MFLQGLKGFQGPKGERVSKSHLIYTVPWSKAPLWEPLSAAAHTDDAPVK